MNDRVAVARRNAQVLAMVKETHCLTKTGKAFHLSRERVRQIVQALEPGYDVVASRTEAKEQNLKAAIEALLAMGVITNNDIATALGVNASTVCVWLKTFGITLPPAKDEMIEQTIGLWFVLRRVYKTADGNYQDHPDPEGSRIIFYWCRCQGCGKEKAVEKRYLQSHSSNACGACAAKQRLHNHGCKVRNRNTRKVFASIKEAAIVAGITPGAFRYRLSCKLPIAGAIWERVPRSGVTR